MAIATALPAANADSSALATPTRTGKYLEAYVASVTGKEWFLSAEGTYFMATNPTPGTGILGTASIAAITDVSPTFLVVNGNSAGGPNIYPQFLNLHETAASSGGARVQFTFYTDNANRYSSAGTALTIKSTKSGGPISSNATIYAGQIVATAQNAKLQIDHVVYRGTIDIIEDQFEFIFGGLGAGNSSTSRVATVADFSKTLPPVCIQPGHSMLMHQWAASQTTAPTYEYRFGYIER